jgi:hypothetical protein
MKNIYKYLLNAKKKRKNELALLKYIRKCMESGIYTFHGNRIEKDKSHILSVYNYLIVNFRKKIVYCNITLKKSSFAEFKCGYSKKTFLFDKYAIGFYHRKELFELAEKNCCDYLNDLNYPIVKIICFNKINYSVLMENISGIQYNDRLHDYVIIKHLFKYALSAKCCIDDGVCKYIQHGDVKPNNIIWLQDNRFVFIDLDEIGFKPLLFDILHYCAMSNMSLEDIIIILENNTTSIVKILSNFGLGFDSDSIDTIFYEYVMFFVQLDDCYEDIEFLTHGDAKRFTRTNTLLEMIVKKKILFKE